MGSYRKAVEKGSATEAETDAALDRITFTTDLGEGGQRYCFVLVDADTGERDYVTTSAPQTGVSAVSDAERYPGGNGITSGSISESVRPSRVEYTGRRNP